MIDEDVKYKLLDIPIIKDYRGCLGVIEEGAFGLFDIKRIYYLYNTLPGESRGMHAHYRLQQLIIPISGSFKIKLQTKDTKEIIELNNPNQALYIGSMVWRDIFDFSPQAVCLVLASLVYDESDYIRDFDEFKKQAGVLP